MKQNSHRKHRNIEVKDLEKIGCRYFNISQNEGEEPYSNENFVELLKYIGEHSSTRTRNPSRTSIGCAYEEIRRETDRLIGIRWRHCWLLKTSKNEIRSIRKAKVHVLTNDPALIRIPYKIGFIFEAIINLVENTKKFEPISEELQKYVNQTYASAFYQRHIMEYRKQFNLSLYQDSLDYEEKSDPAKLRNTLEADGSSLQNLFP